MEEKSHGLTVGYWMVQVIILAKPLHNHFPCMGICNNLSTLIYVNLHISQCGLSGTPNLTKCGFLRCVNVKGSIDVVMVNITLYTLLAQIMIDT